MLGLSQAEIDDIAEHLAAILMVGNLDFASENEGGGASKEGAAAGKSSLFARMGVASTKGDSKGGASEERGCAITDGDAVKRIAELWKVTPKALTAAFTRRSIEVRGETSVIQLRPREALEGCAAAAKSVYGALFSHLVGRVNQLTDGPHGRSVGLLDIFGFEIFEVNSFEQVTPLPSPLCPATSAPPLLLRSHLSFCPSCLRAPRRLATTAARFRRRLAYRPLLLL